MERLKSYFNPYSLTWWTSSAAITTGVAKLYNVQIAVLEYVDPWINAFFPEMGPGPLIMAGLAGIGVGGKLDRQSRKVEEVALEEPVLPFDMYYDEHRPDAE